ncbi:MAG: uroporphyrinogen-III C-methyltransferase [Candidatus Bipolaricaulia bacterium]
MAGMVYLVGAGPGDPELMTLKALKAIEVADVIIYDSLVGAKIVENLSEDVELIACGKRARPNLTQESINELMAKKVREGKTVVRLKGGDPTILGRLGEEMVFLREHGISFEVVPGITSAIAAPVAAGISLTHRGLASSVVFLTGYQASVSSALDWESLVKCNGTLVILMGVTRLEEITLELVRHGMNADMPVAIVEKAMLPDQRVTVGELGTIVEVAKLKGVRPPAVLIVGQVVSLGVRR